MACNYERKQRNHVILDTAYEISYYYLYDRKHSVNTV